jgi:hypothetical protein
MQQFENKQVELLIDRLVIIALVTGMVSMLIHGHLLAKTAFFDFNNSATAMRFPTSYKVLKFIEIFCVFGAGFLAYKTRRKDYVPTAARILMWTMFLWMLGHAVITFHDGFTLSEPFGVKGPIVWWSVLFLFAGVSKRRWNVIYPVLKVIILVASIHMLFSIVSLGGYFNRHIAVQTLRITLNLLLWTAPLIFLIPHKKISQTIAAILPLGIIGMAAILTATRSWIMICVIYVLVVLNHYLRKFHKAPQKVVIVYSILLLLGVMASFAYVTFDLQLLEAGNILANRMSVDSRTAQLELFFQRVPLFDLIVGAGPRGTWRWMDWGSRANYRYVDGPFLLMLFIGGIPLLVSYFYLVIYPSLMAFKKTKLSKTNPINAACIILGLIWTLTMTGFSTFTFPGLQLSHYVVLLCAGRCWGILREKSLNIQREI